MDDDGYYDDPEPWGFNWHDERKRCRECYLSGTLKNYYKGVSARDLPDDYFRRDRWGRERCKTHHAAYMAERFPLAYARKVYKLYAKDLEGVPYEERPNLYNPNAPEKWYTRSALEKAEKVKAEKVRAKDLERERKNSEAEAKKRGIGQEGGVYCPNCPRWFKNTRGLGIHKRACKPILA